MPALVSQPGRVPSNVVNSSLLSGYDLMPTLLDYVGLEVPPDLARGLPGRSFTRLLEGDTDDGAEFVVVYDEYGPVRMIRTSDGGASWQQ